MTRQDIMPFVGKYVSIDPPDGFHSSYTGILALHKVQDIVCIGSADCVFPLLDLSLCGGIPLLALNGIRIKESWEATLTPSWLYRKSLTGKRQPFDKSEWLFEPVQEVSKPVQDASSMWNAVCPHCGALAYISCFSAECSNAGCGFGK